MSFFGSMQGAAYSGCAILRKTLVVIKVGVQIDHYRDIESREDNPSSEISKVPRRR